VRQPVHRDGSLLSVNIALSRSLDYTGGGTFFEGLHADSQHEDAAPSAVLSLEQGHAMCHASGVRHAGHRITSGERWVLVIFLISERNVQAARRVAELAWEAQAKGELEWSATLFNACLEMEDNDYELYYGMASTLAMMGHAKDARALLLLATQRYACSPKVQVALGSLLLKARRPRAALRRFERTLELASDADDEEAKEASMYAGLCGVRLAQAQPAYSSAFLPQAKRRLTQALEVADASKRHAVEGLLMQANALSR